jgi:hypothetical protein
VVEKWHVENQTGELGKGGVACFFVESRIGKADMARERAMGMGCGEACGRLVRSAVEVWDVVLGWGSRDGP